jgi:hypothetical protein
MAALLAGLQCLFGQEAGKVKNGLRWLCFLPKTASA